MGHEHGGGEPERARWPRLGAAPHPLLRPSLARAYGGFTEATAPRHLVLPATAAVGLVVKMRDSPHRPPAFLMGAHGTYAAVEGECAPSYLEVWLAPLGAYTLLGRPVDELHGLTVDLVDVLGADGRWWAERLREAPTWTRRFALVDAFLLGRLDRGPQPAPEVRHVWRRLVATGGAVPIGTLAREVGWSHRHLIARFRREAGLTPKTAARLVRFDAVWRRLTPGPQRDRPRWERIAAEAGYADQAHLVRDFREFTGTTPTALTARLVRDHEPGGREVNSVQDPLPARP